jgi:hypothetical protein
MMSGMTLRLQTRSVTKTQTNNTFIAEASDEEDEDEEYIDEVNVLEYYTLLIIHFTLLRH